MDCKAASTLQRALVQREKTEEMKTSVGVGEWRKAKIGACQIFGGGRQRGVRPNMSEGRTPNLTPARMSALGRMSALDPSDVRQDLGTPLTSSTRRFCDCPKGGQGFSATSTLTATTYMGRRAKYLTNDERASAHRADNTRHYQRPSAQVVLAASHRAYYINRTSGLEYRRPRHSIPYLPPLPHEIHRLNKSAFQYQSALPGCPRRRGYGLSLTRRFNGGWRNPPSRWISM
ncbi:hypothetical protein B0H14DRAFT_2598551 [Mycena olivaceomarginata]|nr:hypothetical protein B0H14DRAFT_2598551 [Mycena olivaceomarginata]